VGAEIQSIEADPQETNQYRQQRQHEPHVPVGS
jgi:hypothetical protein